MMSCRQRARFLLTLFAIGLSTCTSTDSPATMPTAPWPEQTADTELVHLLPSTPSLKPIDFANIFPLNQIVEDQNFLSELALCPRMAISNAPRAQADLWITNYQPMVKVMGVEIAVAPVESGCFSSGYGPRNGRAHKGIDLHNSAPVNVYAAANGIIREKEYHDGYGNMLVIEHGPGVYARYAHLQIFADNVQLGASVIRGQTIGIMGNTASYRIARHLHYEVLTGEYGAQTGAFNLTPVDLFAKLP